MNKYTALLTDEQIKCFYDEHSITVKYLNGETKKVKFNINVNGKTYNFGKQNNLTMADVEDQALTLYCYDFGCDFRIPNLDPNSVSIADIKAKYVAFMKKAMKEISPETGKEYVQAMKNQRMEAKKERETVFSI